MLLDVDLATSFDLVGQRLESLAADAEYELCRQGARCGEVRLKRRVHVRYEGTDFALLVPFGTPAQIERSFAEAYRQQVSPRGLLRRLVVEAASVEAVDAAEVRPPAT